jgi:streptomycin 6-kinase
METSIRPAEGRIDGGKPRPSPTRARHASPLRDKGGTIPTVVEIRLDPRVRENVVAWEGEAGRRWLDSLPGVVAALADRWELVDFGSVLPGGSHSYVVPVRSPHGPAVLKVPLVGDENRLEGEALRLYDGDGAVRLLASDAGTGGLLIEQCVPGTPLDDHPDGEEAIDLACATLRRLWREPPARHQFILVTRKAAEWAAAFTRHLAGAGGAPAPRALVEEAAALARELARDAGPVVLVNRDAHLGNILAAAREPWLLIDPKPLAGDPAFDAGYLAGYLAGSTPTRAEVARVVARLAEALGVDRARVRAWTMIRAVENMFWALQVNDDPSPYVALADGASRGAS